MQRRKQAAGTEDIIEIIRHGVACAHVRAPWRKPCEGALEKEHTRAALPRGGAREQPIAAKPPPGWIRTGWPSAATRLCVADEMVKVPADSSLVAVIIHRNITTACAQKLPMRCQEPESREVPASTQGSKARGV